MKHVKFRKSVHSKEHKLLRELWVTQRKRLKLSQQQLADKLNVIYSLIGKIETGDRRLDSVETVEYCRALNIEPIDVVKLIEEALNK